MQHESKMAICKWWLERGFELLPCQANKKYLVAGYGEHRTRINSIEAAELFGFSNNWNVAVLGGIEKIILDFDDIDLYTSWAASHEDIAKTYTEKTPRGGRHVFINGRAPAGLILKPGVELKRVCLVAPSAVDGIGYTRGAGEILPGDPIKIFSSLSRIGTRTAYALTADRARRAHLEGHGPIAEIKKHWDIESVFLTYRPSAELTGKGRYKQACCPFHRDKKPSFFLDTELQIFGCHGCGVRGDVINLYARFQHITNREAISRMSKSLGVKS
jgi:hypothetical protein